MIYLFVLNVFIFEASLEECDVTQFNQLNLNSSFSHLAINSLINLLIYLQKWRQLTRVGLLYNIKVIVDTETTRYSVTFLRRKFCVCIKSADRIFPGELSSLNPLNCPCQMPYDEFKNHLRNIKYFSLKGNLDSRSSLCNIQQSNFCNSTTKWYA